MTDHEEIKDPSSTDQNPTMAIFPDENSPRPSKKTLWVAIIVPTIILVIGMFLAATFMPRTAAKTEEALASMDKRYPGYAGDVSPAGTILATFNSKEILFAYDLQGLEPNCVDCGIHIHEGKTCDDADEVGGHYFSVGVDPWTTMGGAVYNSDANGEAAGSFTLKSGYHTCKENLGHAVVAHSQNGTRLSCGILTVES
jgi:Cu/Zn superoxide dismutase